MGIYVDTANWEEAQAALSKTIISGITTNPTLLRRISSNASETLRKLADLNPKELFIQLTGENVQELQDHLNRVKDILPFANIIFKLPATWESIELCSKLKNKEKFLITAVGTLEQTYLAKEAGASYIAVYVHRYRTRHGEWPPLREMKWATQERVRILAASCHDAGEIRWALLNGADDITLPYHSILELIQSEDTEADVLGFNQDAATLDYLS